MALTLDLNQSIEILSKVDAKKQELLSEISTLKKSINIQTNSIDTLLRTSGVASSVELQNQIRQQYTTLRPLQQLLQTNIDTLKITNTAKTSAQVVICIDQNVPLVSGSTRNPFVGKQGDQGPKGPAADPTGHPAPQGEQGPVGPTGPAGSSGVVLTYDSVPTPGSNNLLTSGALYTALRALPSAYVTTNWSGDPTVAILLHFEGENGSTIIIDDSYDPLDITNVFASNNTQLSTTTCKFGSSSLYVPLSGNGCVYANLPSAIGSRDCTVEMWFYLTAASGIFSLFSVGGSGGITYRINSNNTVIESPGYGSRTIILSTNTWYHFAYVRRGTGAKVFINGEQVGLDYTAPAYIDGSLVQVGTSIVGYVDEFRLSVGNARYTNTFTPPTEPYPSARKVPTNVQNPVDGQTCTDGTNMYVYTAMGGWKPYMMVR